MPGPLVGTGDSVMISTALKELTFYLEKWKFNQAIITQYAVWRGRDYCWKKHIPGTS